MAQRKVVKNMKNFSTLKKTLVGISLFAMFLCSSACTKKTEDPKDTTPGANIQSDAYEEKIAYCMQQIASLEAQLSEKKEQIYVSENQYKLEIAALNATINSLKSQLNGQTSSNSGQSTATENKPSGNTEQTKNNDFTYKKENGGITITKYNGSASEVIIPDKIDGERVLCIGEGAFEASTAGKIVIPEGVQKIDWFAFRSCTQLTEISIPASVTKIEYGAFEYAKSAFVITCPKGSFVEAYAKSWGYICVAK